MVALESRQGGKAHRRGPYGGGGLEEIEAARADGRWDAAYQPQSASGVPEDLRRALAASPAARRFFDRLDSANRYAILYRLHHAKDGAPRAARLAKFIAMLEAGETFHPLRAKRGRKSD